MPTSVPVVVACAGLGSRLGRNLPKALVEVKGQTLLTRLLTGALRPFEDVRIVVGFREADVMAHARAVRDDLIFVRNPNFQSTTVADSFAMAVNDVAGPCLIVDGDMLVDEADFMAFTEACADGRPLIGVTPSRSEQAVFVDLTPGAQRYVVGFRREPAASHEWCGIALVDRAMFATRRTFVYECLERHLPMRAFEVDVAEIDTPADFEGAARWLEARQERAAKVA
jgi:choline kinase